MRSIVTISIPDDEKKIIEKRAKKAGKTVSAYFLWIAKLEQSLIQEDELLQMAREAESDYHAGKTKKLRSLADLMK